MSPLAHLGVNLSLPGCDGKQLRPLLITLMNGEKRSIQGPFLILLPLFVSLCVGQEASLASYEKGEGYGY